MTHTNMTHKKYGIKNMTSSSKQQNKSTIFVQIPSYRDQDCVATVADLFAKAKHPDRLFLGICWQYKPDEGEKLLRFSERENQIRIINVDAGKSKGMSWAKHQAQSLWDNEEYVLQIDSHTRFIQNWDEALLKELAACKSDKAVLSTPPPGFSLTKGINDNARPSYRVPVRFNDTGLLQLTSDFFSTLPKSPIKAAFAASRFMFAKSDLIKDVPSDPHIYLEEEEITLSARLWTHGWDMYTPGKVFVYHLYNSDGKQRPLHWKDHTNWAEFRNISRQRYPYVMGLDAPKSHEVIEGLNEYSIGNVRSLMEYMNFCGVDFNAQAPIKDAKKCAFIKEVQRYTSVQDYWLKASDTKKTGGKAPVFSAVNINDEVVTAVVKKTVAAASPLDVGDFVPFFDLKDQNNNLRELQLYAGKSIILFFLPADDETYIQTFFDALSEKKEKYDEVGLQRIVIVPASVKILEGWLKKYNAHYSLWSDENKAVHGLFSLTKDDIAEATSYLIDANLKIVRSYHSAKVKDHVTRPLTDNKKLLSAKKPKILARHAPVMVIPNVISPELCQDIIQYWEEEGKQYEGTVGVGSNRKVKLETKSRTDTDVHNKELLARIDDALVKAAFPEIRKVGSTDIKYREIYKIGCYKSEKQGHYRQHRDTSTLSLAHRRYSMSVCLNNDYEGGGLNFPEYGTDIYKPEPGSALIFPSTLMHKVEPVTAGKRFVMVSFLYGEDGAVFKCETIKAQTKETFSDEENHVLREIKLDGVKESKVYTQTSHHVAPSFQPKAPPIIGVSGGDASGVVTPTASRDLNIITDGIPPGVLVIDNYLDRKSCKVFTDYADKIAGRPLEVVDNSVEGKGTTKTKRSNSRITDYVSIDGMVDQALPLFINIYDNLLASYYGVEFEWFERPQILRYPAGGKYGQHADAEHYDKQQDAWIRAQDRDYSILVYLNDEYGGGELELNNFDVSIKPTTGMLIAFPSDHRYLHTAVPTTSGLRYAMVSWAAALGTKRVKERAPYAATFMKLRR